MITVNRGILIAVEGIDGSGKSTLAKNVHAQLCALKLPALLTKEPGGTALGKQLRTILQEKNVPVCQKTEFLLFAADRAQHFEELVIPALHSNKIVISDRMADSSLAYQGFGRGLDLSMLSSINTWAMNGIKPDITLFVKVSAQQAFERVAARNETLTSFEKETIEFMERVAHGFETIFKNRTDVVYLDGTKTPEQITNDALQYIHTWMQQQDGINL